MIKLEKALKGAREKKGERYRVSHTLSYTDSASFQKGPWCMWPTVGSSQEEAVLKQASSWWCLECRSEVINYSRDLWLFYRKQFYSATGGGASNFGV